VTAGPVVAAKELVRLQPTPGAHRVALRAGVSVAVPLLTVLALGHPEWSLYAAFGAFASLYGRNHVHLSRLAMQASAGAALTGAVALGVLVGAAPSRQWLAVAVAALVAALGTMLSAAQDWHPPGPLFLVFGFGAAASFPHRVDEVPVAVLVAGLTGAFALLVGNVGAFVRRQRSAPARLAPVWTWQPARLALAVGIAATLATLAGIGHPYWAVVAAAAPLSARGLRHQLLRASHRIVGTLLGLVVSAVLLALGLSPVATVLVVVVLQIVTELVVGRNYGLAMLFITPMALLMGQIAAPQPARDLLVDRGVETAIGAAVAVAVVLLEERLRRRV
jgi:uncharacterized membrane protein YccC